MKTPDELFMELVSGSPAANAGTDMTEADALATLAKAYQDSSDWANAMTSWFDFGCGEGSSFAIVRLEPNGEPVFTPISPDEVCVNPDGTLTVTEAD